MRVLRETQFAGLTPAARGKVRDVYDLGNKLLIVATDRLSAFDVILPTPIPDKGRVLTQLSLFWFRLLQDVIPNHVLSDTDFPAPFDKFKDELAGRSMVVRKTQPLPIECVVRGYVSGSGWKDYRTTGKICGIPLPTGLSESDRLEKVRAVSLEIYRRAAAYAEPRGIILADTKFEFGLLHNELIWIDEALTPDSSRFWPAAHYSPGGPQASFDKQFVRDYLERMQWPKTLPGPELPPEVVEATRAKYREAYRILAGRDLD